MRFLQKLRLLRMILSENAQKYEKFGKIENIQDSEKTQICILRSPSEVAELLNSKKLKN